MNVHRMLAGRAAGVLGRSRYSHEILRLWGVQIKPTNPEMPAIRQIWPCAAL